MPDWPEKLLLENLASRKRTVFDLDQLIEARKAEIKARYSFIWEAEGFDADVKDPKVVALLKAREEATVSVEQIEAELERRKTNRK